MSQVADSLGPYKYGCLKGYSTTVYLVRLYHLIVQWLESGDAFVDLQLVDYGKAFDLIKHLVAATILKRIGACKHILLLVIDFLRSQYQRVYTLFAGDLDSDWEEITCGAHQGTKLAALFFFAVFNNVTDNKDDRFKYVDDLSALLSSQ